MKKKFCIDFLSIQILFILAKIKYQKQIPSTENKLKLILNSTNKESWNAYNFGIEQEFGQLVEHKTNYKYYNIHDFHTMKDHWYKTNYKYYNIHDFHTMKDHWYKTNYKYYNIHDFHTMKDHWYKTNSKYYNIHDFHTMKDHWYETNYKYYNIHDFHTMKDHALV